MLRGPFIRAGAMLAPVLAAGSGVAWGQAERPLTPVRFISSPSDDLRPILYAQSAGLFKQGGLDFTMQSSSSGAVVAQSVIGGAMDIGKASITSVIAAHARGIPIVLIAPSMIYRKEASTSGIVVTPKSPLRVPRDLEGKVVACTAIGDIGYLGMRALVDKEGGDSGLLKWVEIPVSAVSLAVQQGRVDAGLIVEPYMSEDIKAGKLRLFVDMLEGYPRPILESVFFATHDYVAKNRDVVIRFARVLQESARYCNTHEAETIPLFISYSGMDPRLAYQMHHTTTALAFNAAAIQPVVDLAARYKIIPKAFDARELISQP
jgi:NitT/TauT family transport system substrate-binding protein